MLLLVVIALCITVAVVAGLFFIPLGTCIHVATAVTPRTVSIMGCSLREVYMLSYNSPELSSSYDGDRVIVIKVFDRQTEISTVEKTNITNYIGTYVIDSPTLPSDLSVNSELRVIVQLRDSTGNLLAQDETSILYK
jgi:hypothetical protein